MFSTVYIAMFGWPVVVLAMFALLPTRRAVLASFVIGWLFLPIVHFKAAGLPEYSKTTATILAVLLGMILFDSKRLMALRPSWMDVPMAVWCCCPFISSVINGLGVHDGFTMVYFQVLNWAAPYIIGRVYFGDFEGMRELSLGILIGGLVYVPLCLFEVRMGPILHLDLYGFMQKSVFESKRYGSFRPMVFMQTGLAVGLWMADATLIAIWVWYTKAARRVTWMPMGTAALILFITTVLCKSMGALCIMSAVLALLWAARRWKAVVPFYCLILIVPGYIGIRLTNIVTSKEISAAMSNVFDKDRVDSFVFRVQNEEQLSAKAWEAPIFGWGGWGRSDIQNDEGQWVSITDSLWIITFGMWGLVGLSALFATLLLPGWMTWRRYPPGSTHPRLVWLYLQAMLQVIFAIDCLSNAMLNPLFIVSMGGVTTVLMGIVLRPVAAARPVKMQRRRTAPLPGM